MYNHSKYSEKHVHLNIIVKVKVGRLPCLALLGASPLGIGMNTSHFITLLRSSFFSVHGLKLQFVLSLRFENTSRLIPSSMLRTEAARRLRV
jgi:hypothetical protein